MLKKIWFGMPVVVLGSLLAALALVGYVTSKNARR